MSADIKLVWISVRDPHTRRVDENEGRAYDEKVPVGVVRLASDDPMNRGAWRWSMSAYGRGCRGDRSVKRAGAAATKDHAKVGCERAYRDLLAAAPGNRDAIHKHHAAIEQRADMFASGEGLTRALEAERHEP